MKTMEELLAERNRINREITAFKREQHRPWRKGERMKEKETYRDNLEEIEKFFHGRRLLTIPDAARYMNCAADLLYRDARFGEYTIPLGKQRRISAVNLARYLS